MSVSQILPNGRVLRYTFHERLLHWLAGVSYVYLLLTGLAFWSPWLYWIGMALGGAAVSREIHPWAGLVFTLAVVLMYRIWGAQMREAEADKAWRQALPHYVRNEDEQVPSAGRFNYGQKLLFWGFFWCGLLLLLTGLILWFPESMSGSLRYLRYLAVILHPAAALVTIGLFIIHVYMGTAVERGAFASVIRGDVSQAWAHKHHRIWYEQILRDTPARK